MCVLLSIMHSSFIENITSRRPSAILHRPPPPPPLQRAPTPLQRELYFDFIPHENKYLVALCRLPRDCPTSEGEFGNSNKALMTQGGKLVLHWPLQVQHRLLHSLGERLNLPSNLLRPLQCWLPVICACVVALTHSPTSCSPFIISTVNQFLKICYYSSIFTENKDD